MFGNTRPPHRLLEESSEQSNRCVGVGSGASSQAGSQGVDETIEFPLDLAFPKYEAPPTLISQFDECFLITANSRVEDLQPPMHVGAGMKNTVATLVSVPVTAMHENHYSGVSKYEVGTSRKFALVGLESAEGFGNACPNL